MKIIKNHFDFRPAAIIEKLNLKRHIYKPTVSYSHFGRTDINLTWEENYYLSVI